LTPRIAAIRRRFRGREVPEPAMSKDQAIELLRRAAGQHAAYYRDTNPRNLLITTTGPVTVDFDDITSPRSATTSPNCSLPSP